MSHDLRQALGYRRLPTKDEREDEMRSRWYAAKIGLEAAGSPDSGKERDAFQQINDELCNYLWKRTMDEIEEDRRRHPKAKRNAAVGSRIGAAGEKSGGGGRVLP